MGSVFQLQVRERTFRPERQNMWLLAGKFTVLIPIVAFLLNYFAGAYVYAQRNRNRVNIAFLLFNVNSTCWLGSEFLLYFPLARGYETEIWRWSSVFWIFAGVLYLEFANAVVGKKRDWLSYLGFATATVGYFFTGFTERVFVGVRFYEWGTAPMENPLFHLITSANTAIFTAIGMGVMVHKAHYSSDEIQKKIIRLLLFGTVVAASTITVVNVLLPNIFHIYNIPRYGASAIAVFQILVFYSIVKYRFLSISPHEVAEEIYEGVKVGILLLDADGTVTRGNREAAGLLGRIPLGKKIDRLFPGYEMSGEFTGLEVKKERNGWPRYLTLSASRVVHGGQSVGTILMIQDITDQKNAEAILRQSRDELEREVQLRTSQLRRAQRMEAIGTLAGGIAHDFNNSLAAVLGFSKAALMDLPAEDPIRQDLTEVILAANRGRDMVNQILTLSRKENKADFKVIDIVSLAMETLKLMQVSTPQHVSVKTEIRLEKPFVKGASTQLSQVLMNLYTNACHAMLNHSEGTLTMGLENVSIARGTEITNGMLPAGEYVCIRISDTGSGIRSEHLAHLFDPFFTTKSRDEGTGLGLASAQVIIHNHDGEITVESEEGNGATFTIYLPVQSREEVRVSLQPQRISDYGAPVAGGEILWVDDKPQILRMGKRMLSPLGYSVTTAENGREALALIQPAPTRFCLVITDYSMPEMSGTDLAGEIKKISPAIPVILLSGYGDAISQEELSASEIGAFLTKPVEARELSRTIHEILTGK